MISCRVYSETATGQSLLRYAVRTWAAAPNRFSSTQERTTLVTSEPTASAMVCTSDRQPGALRGTDRVDDGQGVRAEVQRHADRRHAVGEQLDQAPGQTGQVPAVGHLVVPDRLRSLDLDARAVRRDAVERLEREARLDQPGDRPGDDPHLGEAALQGGLGQVARLARSGRRSPGSARATMTRRRCAGRSSQSRRTGWSSLARALSALPPRSRRAQLDSVAGGCRSPVYPSAGSGHRGVCGSSRAPPTVAVAGPSC